MIETQNEEIFEEIMGFLAIYLIKNIDKLKGFNRTNHYQSLIGILFSKSNFISKSIIDSLICLSFGLLDLKIISVFNPLFPFFIIEIIIEPNIFKSMKDGIKIYSLQRIKDFYNNQEMFFLRSEENSFFQFFLISYLLRILFYVELDEICKGLIQQLIGILIDQSLKVSRGESGISTEALTLIGGIFKELKEISENYDKLIELHITDSSFENKKKFSDTISPFCNADIRQNIIKKYAKTCQEILEKKKLF